MELIASLSEKPLKKAAIISISKKFGLSQKEAAYLAGVSLRTYQRQKRTRALSRSASELGIKLAELYEIGLTTFDQDKNSFLAWMKTPIPAINNYIPYSLINSTLGIELVKEELLRIEHGIY